MVIRSEFRRRKYRDGDHRADAPTLTEMQFNEKHYVCGLYFIASTQDCIADKSFYFNFFFGLMLLV